MTDETLQAETEPQIEQEIVQDDTPDSVNPDAGAGDAPAEPKKIEFTPEQQAVFDSKVNDMTRETHNERREKEAFRTRVQELEAEKPKETRPELPALLENWEDGFDKSLTDYTKAVSDQASFDTRQNLVQQQQQQAQLAQQQEAQQKLQSVALEYKARGESFGLNATDMDNAGNAVVNAGLSFDIQAHILMDKSGPLITDFLSKNHVELNNLRSIKTPMAQAAYIESTIKPKASATRKPTSAPEPADILQPSNSPPTGQGKDGHTYT